MATDTQDACYHVGLHLGLRLVSLARMAERYSTEVQQLTRTRADLQGRGRTVTCTDGRGWTCRRQMACKRSAVRARLAPPRSEAIFELRTDERSFLRGIPRGKIRQKLGV